MTQSSCRGLPEFFVQQTKQAERCIDIDFMPKGLLISIAEIQSLAILGAWDLKRDFAVEILARSNALWCSSIPSALRAIRASCQLLPCFQLPTSVLLVQSLLSSMAIGTEDPTQSP